VSGGDTPRLVDADSGRVIVERLELATTFWTRFCGWQFRALPPAGTGLLIAPSNSIHSFWMRFAFDAIFLDATGHVVAVKSGVAPWRIVMPVWKAKAVLEIPARRVKVMVGQRLAIAGGRQPPVLAGLVLIDCAD
jgi:uncharacterized protein